jgi:hypothetical protein
MHDVLVDVEVQYFESCPNWRAADATLRATLEWSGRRDVVIRYVEVTTPEQAEALGFRG